MTQTKAYKLNIVEGEHVGHNVVVDAFGVDFHGRDPETAGYCLDCREPLDVYAAQPQPAPDAETCEYCDTPVDAPNFAYHFCTGRKIR